MRRNPDDDNPFAEFFSDADDEDYGYESGDDFGIGAVFDEQEDQARVRQVLGSSQPSLAQDLVREALAGGLRVSQARYAELGQALSQEGLDRSTRTLYREARRILERAWGLDAVRVSPARSAKYARVQVPAEIRDDGAGPIFPRFAVHRFGTKETLVPREGRTERLAPGQTYYGFDAISRAVEEYRSDMRNQIAEQEAKIQKLAGGRGGATADRKRLRAQRKRERLRAELAAFEEGVQRLHSPPAEPTPASGKDPVRASTKGGAATEARRMAERGASRVEVRQYLIDNNIVGREMAAVVRALFPRA
jgi:hypothetical protein